MNLKQFHHGYIFVVDETGMPHCHSSVIYVVVGIARDLVRDFYGKIRGVMLPRWEASHIFQLTAFNFPSHLSWLYL